MQNTHRNVLAESDSVLDLAVRGEVVEAGDQLILLSAGRLYQMTIPNEYLMYPEPELGKGWVKGVNWNTGEETLNRMYLANELCIGTLFWQKAVINQAKGKVTHTLFLQKLIEVIS